MASLHHFGKLPEAASFLEADKVRLIKKMRTRPLRQDSKDISAYNYLYNNVQLTAYFHHCMTHSSLNHQCTSDLPVSKCFSVLSRNQVEAGIENPWDHFSLYFLQTALCCSHAAAWHSLLQ